MAVFGWGNSMICVTCIKTSLLTEEILYIIIIIITITIIITIYYNNKFQWNILGCTIVPKFSGLHGNLFTDGACILLRLLIILMDLTSSLIITR
jgi:hypothetical protein